MSAKRRDPRAERAAVVVAEAPRWRIDRTHRGGAVAQGATVAPAAAPVVTIADPAYLVFAVVEMAGGVLSRHDRQVLGAARLLDGGGTAAVVLLAPGLPEDAGAAGADRVMVLPARDDPAALAASVAAAIGAHRPRHAVFAESADGGDLARRVAALCDEALFDAVESLSARQAIRPAAAGRAEWRVAPPRLLSIAADRIAPWRGAAHAAEPVDPPADPARDAALAVRLSPLPVEAANVRLDEAGFVIAAGNGVTDFAGFRDLARALGATPGASRVVCDAGALPRAMQVGASGTVLNADCYVAFGISGAPQHLQGIGTVEHVVAVNTDLHAAMIARADLAVVADAQAVLPALLARLGAEA
ncbi:electron transfer flavoprotein subunit alpha/FixB family protein [Acidiphilium sp.]|uniref:electron transfer flavoprotein subunit alpha/FixB family protein n=1 Tax=Acidiphilium sp. TaxID=527 RepID=UPI00258D5415|nr:electron transfer flavoprotein subunit alpha/FixB family protein [Acidiphilium sp.]